jgi:glutathione S-transferase
LQGVRPRPSRIPPLENVYDDYLVLREGRHAMQPTRLRPHSLSQRDPAGCALPVAAGDAQAQIFPQIYLRLYQSPNATLLGKMIVVHHLANSRSQRVLWLLEELAVPYTVRRYERDPTTMLAPPELIQVHPLGKSPVISDGDLTLAESGAIIEYLVDKYGQGRLKPKPSTDEAVRYLYWMHFAEGSAMVPLLMKLVFDNIETKSPFLIRPIAIGISRKVKSIIVTPNIERHLVYMEQELGKSTWFAGDEFTAADVQMSFPLEAAASRAGLGDKYPNLMRYLTAIHDRPAYKKALEQGSPYSI